MSFVFANFMRRIEVDMKTSCWNYTRYKMPPPNGYGRMTFRGKQKLVHRVSKYLFGHMTKEQFNDPNCVVMHTCDNPPCLNPYHLELGTQKDNIADRKSKGRTAKHLNRRDASGRFK